MTGAAVERVRVAPGHTIEIALDGEIDHIATTGFATELAARYLRHGDRFLDGASGRFALALSDARSGTVIIARDRFGERGLFIRQGRSPAFASDLSLLAELTGAAPDPCAVTEYLVFNHPLAPRTYYRDISQAEPGMLVTFGRAGTEQQRRRLPGDDPDDADLAERLGALVERQRRGALFHLSGGVDSSLLCWLASARGDPPPVITAYYDVDDDLLYSRRVARELAATHHELRLSASDLVTDVEELVADTGGPVMAVGVPTFARLARATIAAGMSAAVSGIGGDHAGIGYARRCVDATPETLLAACANVDLAQLTRLLGPAWQQPLSELRRRFTALLAPDLTVPDQIEGFFRQHFLLEHLRMAHRAHVRVGVQLRSPFLDARVQALLKAEGERARAKSALRALLAAFGSCAARRDGKQQMAATPRALVEALRAPLLRDLSDGVRLPAVDYAYALAIAESPQPSKLDARLLWLLHNLHVWFRRLGRVTTELQ